VSEERGEISVALDGALRRGLDEKELRAMLYALFVRTPRAGAGAVAARIGAPEGKEGPRAAL
jgi:diadenylate cyclase